MSGAIEFWRLLPEMIRLETIHMVTKMVHIEEVFKISVEVLVRPAMDAPEFPRCPGTNADNPIVVRLLCPLPEPARTP